ncbi:hypothetical protein DL93DRAFT_2086001 [Clavulina sp. PMI_390]|nr:hypothetical protein DL93DRAFT_2086001 [Clavulina sp. PMI_390]
MKALGIPEILALILSYVASKSQPPARSRRDLLHCALVCHQWEDTSLKLLWASILRLSTLFEIMGPIVSIKPATIPISTATQTHVC